MQDRQSQDARALAQEAHQAARDAGVAAACRILEAAADPLVAALAYNGLAQTLYRQDKDVNAMIEAGRRGVDFALGQAGRAVGEASRTAAELKDTARKIAYNVAANAWPGWGDEGIEITAEQRAAGRDMARLVLSLVQALAPGQKPLGNAHWLLGAHDIAAGRPDAAIGELDRATAAFAAAGDSALQLMARGYRAMALKLSPETRAAGRAELDEVLRALEAEGSDDAKFFHAQIVTADRILCRDANGPE